MSRYRDRTVYTPLWETWCDTCTKGVSPDHANRCVWCETPTRRNHHANRDHPTRYPLIPTDLFDAARRAIGGGVPLAEFSRAALPHTGYATANALAKTISSEFFRRGWPMTSNHEGSRRAKKRYAIRLASGERPEGLCSGVTLANRPCSRAATPGEAWCNLHHPETGAAARELYALRNRERAAARYGGYILLSSYAERIDVWRKAYGYGWRIAAQSRAGIHAGTLASYMNDIRTGRARRMGPATQAKFDAWLATDPVPMVGDGRREAAA